MTEKQWIEQAKSEGFSAAFLSPEQIPVNETFRVYCQENRCGKYGANYSCPPDCGTVEQMRQRILSQSRVMVLSSQWEIQGPGDSQGIQQSRQAHNAGILRLLDTFRQEGLEGFAAGYSGCQLCSPCKRTQNQPCPFPQRRMSCMSAYCVDVGELARRCSLDFAWSEQRLYLFGMIAFHSP